MIETMERVKELAAEHELTMFQLAELCGVPYQTLKRAEDRNGQLKVDTIERICRGLRMPVRDFFPED